MAMPLEKALVAISGLSEAESVGSGFLIDDRRVATCAHVVNAALGRQQDEAARPPASEKVAIRFRVVGADESKPLLAHVAEEDGAWNPPPARQKQGADFCLLELEGDVPAFVAHVELGQSRNLVGRSFRAAGFPKNWDYDVASGRIVGEDQGFFLLRPDPGTTPSLLLRPLKLVGAEPRPAGVIYHGFSGGPVEVDETVVGMLVEARRLIPDATAYMMPVSAFPKRFSKRARRISADEAVATRVAEPGSPNSVLVTNYLEGISAESDATEIFIRRRLIEQPEVAASVPAAADATKPEQEYIASATERVNRLVLLGEPGLGKSTALKHLEAETAAATLQGGESSSDFLIPILIELKNYHGEAELESLLATRVNEVLRRTRTSLSADAEQSVSIMKAWLSDPAFQFLILLDAMDEMPAEHYEQARGSLRTLLNYPHRFIVSCRPADYDQSLHDLTQRFALVPLGSEEIRGFLNRVLGDKGEALFKEQLEFDNRMVSLASNPLFLNMIVEMAKRDMKLPRNRGLLFRGFVDVMIKRQRRSGSRLLVAPDIVVGALAALGAEMLDRGMARPALGVLRQWPIPRDGNGLEAVLNEARKFRFLGSDGSGGDPVEFIHPLWSEYFGAEYLNGLLNAAKPDLKNILGKRVSNRRWREAILMLAGLSVRPTEFIKWFAARLKTEARSGRLFSAERRNFFWLSILNLFTTQVDLLVKCWETSAVSGNAETRKVVVDLLRTVIEHAGPAVNADSSAPECIAALRAVRNLGAVEALPGIYKFLTFRPDREKSFFGFLSKFFPLSTFDLARRIADELEQKVDKGELEAPRNP